MFLDLPSTNFAACSFSAVGSIDPSDPLRSTWWHRTLYALQPCGARCYSLPPPAASCRSGGNARSPRRLLHCSESHPTSRFGRPGPEESPRQIFPELSTTDQFTSQSDFCDIGRGEFVTDRHAVGSTQQMQLHSIEGEGTPPHPRRSLNPCRLLDLARMQHRNQRRVDEQSLRISKQLGHDYAAQGLQ